MRHLFLMTIFGVIVLAVLSAIMPPVAMWVGGMVGIIVFICMGILSTKLIKQ